MASTVTVGQTYALVADLPLQIESYSVAPLSAPMGPDRIRRTTHVQLSGAGEEGIGEDATPIEEDQLAFQEAAPTLPVAGEWTIDSFSSHLAALDLYPAPPVHERLRSFRRWAFESAALDLALRQAGRSLADVLGREARPLTFVNSIHLADPPSFEPIRERLELFPALRFKLDPTTEWDERLIAEIAATGAVDTADLKSQYPPPFGRPPTRGCTRRWCARSRRRGSRTPRSRPRPDRCSSRICPASPGTESSGRSPISNGSRCVRGRSTSSPCASAR